MYYIFCWASYYSDFFIRKIYCQYDYVIIFFEGVLIICSYLSALCHCTLRLSGPSAEEGNEVTWCRFDSPAHLHRNVCFL